MKGLRLGGRRVRREYAKKYIKPGRDAVHAHAREQRRGEGRSARREYCGDGVEATARCDGRSASSVTDG